MNVKADDATSPDSEATVATAPAAADTEAPAPKRAPRKRAVKAATEAGPEAPAAEAADASAEAPPAKPVRRRRAAAAADGEGTPAAAPAPDASAAPADVPAPTAYVAATVDAVAPTPPRGHPPSHVTPVAEAAAEVVSTGEAAPGPVMGEGGEGGEGAPSERARRRNRRDRRRGREGAKAGEAGEAGASEDEGGDEEMAEVEVIEALPPTDPGEVFAEVVSGAFDAAEPEAPAEAPAPVQHKRVLRPDVDAPKLHKVLAQAGVGSRRDMEQLILDGKITVNGQAAHIGQRISFGDHIKVDGKPVKVRIVPPAPRVVAYHKPVGEVVTHDDPQHRPTVFRRLPRLAQGKWQSVGRLDINTEGLLLFTNSGELANQLMHPRFGVEREYAVRVLGTLDDEAKAELLEGVDIDGQTASFKSIEDGGGEGANHWYRVVITEGRNREVRKLFDAVGLTVSRLIRIRYGTVVLPRGLKRGVWVDLGEDDVRAIRRLAGGGDGAPQQREERRGGRNKNKRNRNDRNEGAPRSERHEGGPRNGPPRGGRAPEPPVQRADVPREREDFDAEDDFDPSRIPNPLEQTFDKRFVQNPRTSVGGRGFRSGGGGFGSGGSAPAPKKGGGPKEPDPLQTSVGYIGADAFHRKGGRGGGRGGGGGFGGNRGGGGFGGGGGGFGGNRGGRGR